GERAMVHQFAQALAEGKVDTTGVGMLDLMMRFPGYLSRQHAALLGHFNDLVEFSKLPSEEGDKQFQALEKRLPEQPLLVRYLVPATEKIRGAERRTHANLRCAVAALAAERYRLA